MSYADIDIQKALLCKAANVVNIMSSVINLADALGYTIALTPSLDYGASSVSRLKCFYKRFGFIENKGRYKNFTISESMYRLPKSIL
jgi:hypothetical protein